ncbi:MAG: InlB B-repeat-containing protein, partial [Clostridia bacterium]|nr:InlB B-repeat-containing protein [Clostridia bacterium]
MKNKILKFFVLPLIVFTMAVIFCIPTSAVSLDYSGDSSGNGTGASSTTSGFSVSYDDPIKSICGYRFSIVTSSGTPKSGTKVVNVYLDDKTIGATAYESGQRFIVKSGTVANKKQLANGTEVKSSKSTQSCDYESSSCGFYSTLPQDPDSIGSWIKKSSSSYLNLQRIYVLCGSKIANATASDFILIEPIFWPKLAGTKTAATATELAIYGAAVSGGDKYDGCDGDLSNAGEGSLRNICNYVNREFPNSLYVSDDTDVYDAVTIKSSGRYTYKNIINKGYGCSVLIVKNTITIKKVKIAYHPNGGTASEATINSSGFMVLEDSAWIHSITHGNKADPYNASTFGLTRKGYSFGGWEVKSTGEVLNQSTEYESTVYAQHDDKSKTTANTTTVLCHLYAVWTPNEAKIAYHPNGGSVSVATINSSGFLVLKDSAWIHSVDYGTEADPYNASTFGLTRDGYRFAGWKVKSTSQVLDQNTDYSCTVYAQYDDKTKTVANTKTVYCHLYAVWEDETHTNTISHWKYVGTGGNSPYGNYDALGTSTFNAKNGDTATIPTEAVKNVPGYYNTGKAGSTWGTKTWSEKPIGSTFTQPDQDLELEYYYYAKTLDVVFNKNDGTGSRLNQTFVAGQRVNQFGYYRDGIPRWGDNEGQFGSWDRVGYTLLGWSERASSKTAEYEIYSLVSDEWIGEKVPGQNESGTVYLYAIWEKNTKIEIVPIEPNADFRENTDVISSFWLVNISGDDYTPSTGAKVIFSVYDVTGQKIGGETQDFIVPNNDKNLAYFKWHVPNDLGGTSVKIKASI